MYRFTDKLCDLLYRFFHPALGPVAYDSAAALSDKVVKKFLLALIQMLKMAAHHRKCLVVTG